MDFLTIRGVLVSLHVIAAVIWVGGIFFMQVIMRKVTSDLEGPQRQAIMSKVFTFFFQWVWVAVITILVTGFGIIFGVYGGFGGMPWESFKRVHLMTALGLIMSLVFTYIYFLPYRSLMKARAEGDMKKAAGQVTYIRTFGSVQLVLGIAILIIVSLLG